MNTGQDLNLCKAWHPMIKTCIWLTALHVYGAGVLVITVTWRPLEAFISTYSSSDHRLTEQQGLVEPNQGVNFVTGQEQVKVQV